MATSARAESDLAAYTTVRQSGTDFELDNVCRAALASTSIRFFVPARTNEWNNARSWKSGAGSNNFAGPRSSPERRGESAEKLPLLVFLLADSLLRLVFRLLPAGIRVVFVHRFGGNIGLLAEILLIHHSVLADDEGHYT
jgi:hypothetical protein